MKGRLLPHVTLLAIATVFTAITVTPALASPPDSSPPATCDAFSPTCTVTATTPGIPGESGSPTPVGKSSGSPAPDPCEVDPNSRACSDEQFQSMCSALASSYVQDAGGWANVNVADLNQYLATVGASRGCPPVSGPPPGAPPSPATLAREAAKTIALPRPSGHRSPSEAHLYDGLPFTWVNLWTYFWTDPGTWHPLRATATAGGVSATVTATPMTLSFDPGPGYAAVSCDGPGRPWGPADGNNAPARGACGFAYPRVTSGPVTTTQTITWKVTWTGSGGARGSLPDMSTSAPGRLQVMQVQVVNR